MNDKKQGLNRKDFLQLTAKTAAITAIGTGVLGNFLSSCNPSKTAMLGKSVVTGFTQTSLPYPFSALQPVIDQRTMDIHYTKHAAGYAANLNAAVSKEISNKPASVEVILRSIDKYSAAMRNNAGGHYNHELFWKTMRAPMENNAPTGNLKTAIVNSFGSLEKFMTEFEAAANTRFGSGWAWLYVQQNGQLAIGSTPNQDNPLMSVNAFQGFPLLGLDVWEHAYYLNYQNRRKDYVSGFWKIVNWDFVGDRFAKV
jgi:Fe-Mn family superoxide dismutase